MMRKRVRSIVTVSRRANYLLLQRSLAGLLVLLSLLVLSSGIKAESVDESYYQELHAAYVSLAKEDPQVNQRDRWQALVQEAEALIGRGLDAQLGGKSNFLLGRMYEHIYVQTADSQSLERSLGYFQDVVDLYPEHVLADDSLVTIGDLQREGRKDLAAAQRAWTQVLQRYPEGDMAARAEQRLAQIVGGLKAKRLAAREPKAEKQGGILSRIFGQKEEKDHKAKREPHLGNSEQRKSPQDSFDPRFEVLPLAQKFPRPPIVVIDPGHGGEEEGAHGYDGVLEKDVVLSISLQLEEMLRKRLNVKTVLTRVRDVHVELSDRTQMANANKADIFISVHANASPSKKGSGIETYYLDNTDDKSSLRLAERENAGSQQKLDDLGFMLSDLIQNAKLDDSISLAHYVQQSLVSRIKALYPDTKDLGVKKAPFFVLVGAHMPCILTEVSFIDHPVEGRRLATLEYQQLVAEALFEGIQSYLELRWLPAEKAGTH